MRRVHVDLHVQHRGQATQALRADAECIDLFVQLDTQFFQLGLRAALQQLIHVDVIHQRLLGHQHRSLSGAADADAEHARRAPAGAHQRHGLQHPVDQRVGRVQHHELGLVLRSAAFRSDLHIHRVAGHQFHVHHRGRVVLRVLALELGIGDDRCAQFVVRVVIAAAHAFIDRIFDRALEAFKAYVHADLQEDIHDAGVLADRTLALGAHARVGQDLRDRILRRRALLALIGARQMLQVIERMVVADELQRGGDGFDQVFLLDDGHDVRTRLRWIK